jgi:Metallo-beta-lactamase superfamily
VFGRGFGEAICVHHDGEWIVIDSCVNPETDEPAVLSYLKSIGVNPSESVRLVLITHWDDDHVQGIAQIVAECDRSTVACSMALDRKEIFEFVVQQGRARGRLGSGVDELRAVLFLCRSTDRLTWAKARLPLHPRVAGGEHKVIALSPSDDAVSRSIESIIERATKSKVAFPRRYRAPEGPNGASVAATVPKGETSILLGADLENSHNPQTGWDAVLASARPSKSASIVKVPHHGSEGAHHDGVWEHMVDEGSVAIVTPWVLAGGHLPLKRDLDRLRGVAGRVYLTAMPALRKARKDSEVEKFITKVAGTRVDELRGWGQVRARRQPSESTWRVDLEGDARLIT